MCGVSRSALLLAVGIILCIYVISAAPSRHQTQIAAEKRIFCNFAGCGSKRSSQRTPLDDSYKLLQSIQTENSLPNNYNREISTEFDDESSEITNSGPRFGFSSQRARDDRNFSALQVLREASRNRKLVQEAAMWEILLEKLRQDKVLNAAN